MTDNAIFNPRDPRCKTPYGAVPTGTEVTFSLRPLRTEKYSRGTMTLRLEQSDNATLEKELVWTDTEDDRDVFTGALNTKQYIGLIWYSFRLETRNGEARELGPYLLAVYDGTDRVPDWFGEGLCYQIFPDRFFRTRAPDPWAFPGPRRVHRNWREEPQAGPDEAGNYNRDFFGGNLAGITARLDHLSELGVETLYLCPVFASAENHRYSTGDYLTIDPMLGTEDDFKALCEAAHARGIRVILDGVFSHTGFTSRYFNGDGLYPGPGAAQSKNSPYYAWYQWRNWPKEYESWWGIHTLPTLDKTNPDYQRFLYGGPDSVVRRWLRAGADGWRLDVADELPDAFVAGINAAARVENPEAVVIGEVWEDGVTKVAYGVRRKHLLGRHLDGLMNYPFRTALLDYLLGGPGEGFREAMETLRERYPAFAFHNNMNFLGTHDTPRILTMLALDGKVPEQALTPPPPLTAEQRSRGLALLRLGLLILFAFPGAPTLYYGDEAGLEGYKDPWNRRTYPWGREDEALLDLCRTLGQLRKTSAPLRRGDLRWGDCPERSLSFCRSLEDTRAAVAVNAGDTPVTVTLPWSDAPARDPVTGKKYLPGDGELTLELPPCSGVILVE